MGDLLRQIEAPERTSIVILDACRNDPLSRSFRRKSRSADMGEGLARLSAGTGAFIAFATAPGGNGTGRHRPPQPVHGGAAAPSRTSPGLEINQLMTKVRADVYASTDQEQLPWTNSALLGEFYFVPARGAAAERGLPVALHARDRRGGGDLRGGAAGPETLTGSRTRWKHYLRRFPNGRFGDLVRVMLDDLAEEAATIAPVPTRQQPAGPFEIGRCMGGGDAAWAGMRLLSQGQCGAIEGSWTSIRP